MSSASDEHQNSAELELQTNSVIIYELEPFNLNYNGRNAKQCVLLLQAIRVPQPIILDYLFFDCNDFGFRSSKLVNKTLFHFCVYVDVNVS
jgi:hypothetical protein